VVFLDFNHYYAMGAEHHVYLLTMLQEVFGSKLCNMCAVDSITLDYLWKNKYQVMNESGGTTSLETLFQPHFVCIDSSVKTL